MPNIKPNCTLFHIELYYIYAHSFCSQSHILLHSSFFNSCCFPHFHTFLVPFCSILMIYTCIYMHACTHICTLIYPYSYVYTYDTFTFVYVILFCQIPIYLSLTFATSRLFHNQTPTNVPVACLSHFTLLKVLISAVRCPL